MQERHLTTIRLLNRKNRTLELENEKLKNTIYSAQKHFRYDEHIEGMRVLDTTVRKIFKQEESQ